MVKVYGHPRSGCNFAVRFVASVFYPAIENETRVARTGHWSNRHRVTVRARKLWGDHSFWHGQSDCIYIMRDVRDMALSFYRTKAFQPSSWHSLSFSQFIRRRLDWYMSPGRHARRGVTIIEHWKRHVESWLKRERTCYLVYDDLLDCPERVIETLSLFLDREPVGDSCIGPAGPFPSDTFRTQKWKSAISDSDLDYILSIAGNTLEALCEYRLYRS